jgi:hypothetical protein
LTHLPHHGKSLKIPSPQESGSYSQPSTNKNFHFLTPVDSASSHQTYLFSKISFSIHPAFQFVLNMLRVRRLSKSLHHSLTYRTIITSTCTSINRPKFSVGVNISPVQRNHTTKYSRNCTSTYPINSI